MKIVKYILLSFAIVLSIGLSGCGGGGDSGSGSDGSGSDGSGSGGSGSGETAAQNTYISPNGLEWQAPTYPHMGNWQNSVDYCEQLSWAGHSDWKMPPLSYMYLDYENFSPFRSGIYWSTDEIDASTALALWGGANESAQDGQFNKSDEGNGNGVYCVRNNINTYFTQHPYLYGRWVDVASGDVINIDSNTVYKVDEEVDINHIKVINADSSIAHLIRAGVPDVKLKGEFATISSSPSQGPSRSGYSGIGSMDVVLKNVKQKKEKKVQIQATTDTTLIGSIVNGILYVAEPSTTNDRLVIPENSDLTMPTGDTQVTLIKADNNATFNVSVVGEETDMGILTLTDKEYNFKSYIEDENDWRYFGYNNGENEISYSKTLKICNTGTSDISGVSFVIALDENATDINRTFSTDYDGSAVPFTSGECKSYRASFSFTRPIEDRDVKINITINDNFNALTWNDYASLKVSKYPHHNLYFSSNTKELNGFLVAPGRNLINVQFSSFSYNNFVRVPLVPTDEYDVIISTPKITDEDVYMISSGIVPDTSKMNGFTEVLKNEPDNNSSSASSIALFKGESVSYLAKGDIDFYKIVDMPLIKSKVTHIYTDDNISIPMNTEMNSSTINTSSITLSSSGGSNVSGAVSFDNVRKTIIFSPDANLSEGVYRLLVNSSIESSNGYILGKDESWDISVSGYPSSMSVIGEITSYYYSSVYPNEDLYVNSWLTDNNHLYSKYGGSLLLFDISDPSSMKQVSLTKIAGNTSSSGKGLRVIDDIIYADDSYRSFNIFNASNLSSISRVSSTDLSDFMDLISDSYVSDNYAYVVGFGGTRDFVVLDLSDISNPIKVADSSTISGTIIRVSGDYAYLALSNTLNVVDISDKTNIRKVASLDIGSYINDIKIFNDYIYLPRYDSGLSIVDISNPTSPSLKSTLNTIGNTSYYGSQEVDISGNYAFLADGTNGLRVIDISNKSTPTIVGTFSDGGDIQKVVVDGNFAYIFDATAKHIKSINIQMYK